eukprot:1194848-Prorocentrum_minimum.AAC.5
MRLVGCAMAGGELRSPWGKTVNASAWADGDGEPIVRGKREYAHGTDQSRTSGESRRAMPTAIAPEPVPRSAQRPPLSQGYAATASAHMSINSSVSGRGQSTPGPTASTSSRQCAAATMYCST